MSSVQRQSPSRKLQVGGIDEEYFGPIFTALEGRPTPTGRHADMTIVIAAVLGGLFLGVASSLLQVLMVVSLLPRVNALILRSYGACHGASSP